MARACPFCSYAEGRFDRSLIVFEDDDVLVVPSYLQKPNNEGHFLVATRAHIPTLYDLPAELAGPLLQTVAHTAQCVKDAFRADGISVRQNNDPAGGQDVFHIHFHVVPRLDGDDFEAATYVPVEERIRIDQAEALRRAFGRAPTRLALEAGLSMRAVQPGG
jgi:histidine triad (HIT) family protein